MIVSSYNMDSIPGECEALGLVVYLLYDTILIVFLIIISTWLYNSIIIIIITRTRSHTTKYIHQHDNSLARLCMTRW